MKRRQILRIAFLAATALALLGGVALAAMPSLHIQRATLASSGESIGGGMTLRGSLGQAAVGQSSGGGMTLHSGYWAGAGGPNMTPGVTPTATEQATPKPTTTSTPTSGPTAMPTPIRLWLPQVVSD